MEAREANLLELLEYCHYTGIKTNKYYKEVEYKCSCVDTEIINVDWCMENCPKAGCHIHTAAQDAEKILNHETDEEE